MFCESVNISGQRYFSDVATSLSRSDRDSLVVKVRQIVLPDERPGDSYFALKRFDMTDSGAARRFRQELNVLKVKANAHILPVVAFDDRQGYVVTEFKEATLAALANAVTSSADLRAAWDRVVIAVAGQLLHALADLERLQIVHRDVKPENVLVSSAGGSRLDFSRPGLASLVQCHLFDFDASVDLGQGQSRRERCGTAGFMAPEVVIGLGHTCKADIWSLGATLFQLATGEVLGGDFVSATQTLLALGLYQDYVSDQIRSVVASKVMRRLLLTLLRVNPTLRPSAKLARKLYDVVVMDDL